MNPLVQEKKKAIELRKAGYSYNEILKEVRVAKSSLSSWLKDLPLTEDEKSYLKTRCNSNISRGRIKAASVLRANNLNKREGWAKEARQMYLNHKENRQFLIGIALYWAEGAKRDSVCSFINSDIEMVQTFIRWIEEFLGVHRNELIYRLFIHKPYSHENCEAFWANELGVDETIFRKTIYKPSGRMIKKRPNYKGCLRVIIPRSTKTLLDLKIWQNMLAQEFK